MPTPTMLPTTSAVAPGSPSRPCSASGAEGVGTALGSGGTRGTAVTSEARLVAARIPCSLMSGTFDPRPRASRPGLHWSGRGQLVQCAMGFDQYHEPPDELPAATRTFARLCASLTEEAE